MISTLNDLFVSVGGEICAPNKDDVPIAPGELWTETEMPAVTEAIWSRGNNHNVPSTARVAKGNEYHGSQSSSDWRGN
jgi:hypothetical protein